jgi:UDP-hydrolysing UDP-N-acetyl-D-glucosamine 2-epimerase
MRRVAVVTGTRAEYDLLSGVMRGVQASASMELVTVVTGAHLLGSQGETWRLIERDGFTIDARVDMVLGADTPVGVVKSMGVGMLGLADTLARLAPSVVVVLGDRYEALVAAQVAVVLGIPVAHIAGGDVTEGAQDELFRHAITKLSHLHFVTNGEAGERVRQMGEDPERVYLSGSPGVDNILRVKRLDRIELEASLGMTLGARSYLVTFHPVTLGARGTMEQLEALLEALEGDEAGVIFTRANADAGGQAINARVAQWCAGRAGCGLFDSLGMVRYLSALEHVDAVIGNSSSGLYEAPYLETPTVDIGDRQRGRLKGRSVRTVEPTAEAIREGIAWAVGREGMVFDRLYGEGDAVARIVTALEEAPLDMLRQKSFHRAMAHGAPRSEDMEP